MKWITGTWTRVTLGVVATLALVVGIVLYAFTPTSVEALVSPDVAGEPMAQVGNFGQRGPRGPQGLGDMVSTLPTGDLSDAEVASLLYMREEEKLARDVYLTLGEQWDVQIFQNIAQSEQMHMDAVKDLLDRYGLEDPAAGKDIGEFTDPELQALYDQLVAQGSQSLADALKVGGAIEEIDILDLEERIAETDNVDIKTVYENLMRGSRNHLRAFASTLETMTGETYEPQYLSAEEYAAIVNSGMEQGNGHGADNGQHAPGQGQGQGCEPGQGQGQGHGPGQGQGQGARHGRP